MKQFLLAFLLTMPLVSGDHPDSARVAEQRLDALLRTGIDRIMREDFAGAESIFVHVSDLYGEHPAGPVMRAAVLHLVAEDELAGAELDRIEALHAEAERRAMKFRADDSAGRVALSFLASSRGILSLEAAQAGAWLSAFQYAVKAASLGEEILESDSGSVDAGLVVGSYYYWKSRRVEIILWLPFVADNRAAGIALLRACARSGAYQRYAALNSLGWILRDAGELDEATEWIERGLAEYPGNRALLRSYAAVLETDEDLNGAVRAWETIAVSYGADHHRPAWGELEALARLAELEGRLKDSVAVMEAMTKLLPLERRLGRAELSDKREALLERVARLKRQWPFHIDLDKASQH